MMKTKKLYFSILLFFLTSILLLSCNIEKDFVLQDNNSRIISKKISFSNFKKEINKPNFTWRLKTSLSGSENRTVANFTIDTTSIKVTKSSVDVYSMLAKPIAEEQNNKFYNLVVYKDSQNVLIQDLIEYVPTSPFTGTSSYDKFNYLLATPSSIIFSSRSSTLPFCPKITFVLVCTCQGHEQGDDLCSCDSFESIAVTNWVPCPAVGGVNDDVPHMDPLPNDPTNSQGGNGDTATSETVFPSTSKDNCNELKIIASLPMLKHALSNLDQVKGGTQEKGWAFQYFPQTTSPAPPSAMPQDPKDLHSVTIKNHLGGTTYGFGHCHTDPENGSIQMFSFGDISGLMSVTQKYQPPTGVQKNYSLFFVGGTFMTGQYMIKIKNINDFYMNWNNTKDLNQDLEKAYQELSDNNELTTSNHDKVFLQQINKVNIGIGLYKANADMTKWDEVALSPSNSNYDPIKIPCN